MRRRAKEVVSVTIPPEEMEEIEKLNFTSYYVKKEGGDFKISGTLGVRYDKRYQNTVYKLYWKTLNRDGKLEERSTIVIASSFQKVIETVGDELFFRKVYKLEVENYNPIIEKEFYGQEDIK